MEHRIVFLMLMCSADTVFALSGWPMEWPETTYEL